VPILPFCMHTNAQYVSFCTLSVFNCHALTRPGLHWSLLPLSPARTSWSRAHRLGSAPGYRTSGPWRSNSGWTPSM
jgi:hypothetical protein